MFCMLNDIKIVLTVQSYGMQNKLIKYVLLKGAKAITTGLAMAPMITCAVRGKFKAFKARKSLPLQQDRCTVCAALKMVGSLFLGCCHSPFSLLSVALSDGVDRTCCILSAAGEVYTWGDNDEGQLGDGTTNAIQRPRLVAALQGKKINRVACGSAHTLAWSTSKPTNAGKLPAQVLSLLHKDLQM